MEKRAPYSRGYSLVFAAVTVVVGAVALVRRDGTVTMAAAILSLYILHVLSLRAVVRESAMPSSSRAHAQKPTQPATEDREWMLHLGDPEEEPEFLPVSSDSPPPSLSDTQATTGSEVVIPRKFAIGTVAIIRRALDPAQVARVLEEQRKFPKKRFGELAVERGFIADVQLDELLGAQKAGLFTEVEIQRARAALESYRREQPSATV